MFQRTIILSAVTISMTGCFWGEVPDMNQENRERGQALPDKPVHRDRLNFVLRRQAVYFLYGPHQISAPNGILPGGTRVEVLEGDGIKKYAGYTAVRTADGIEAYVGSVLVVPASQGIRVDKTRPPAKKKQAAENGDREPAKAPQSKKQAAAKETGKQ